MSILEIFAALGGLTGIAAIVSAIVTSRTTARQADVSALVLSVQTLETTVQALETENKRLRDCVEALETGQQADRAELAELRAQVERLTADNRRLRARIAGQGRENTGLPTRLHPAPAGPPAGPPPAAAARLSSPVTRPGEARHGAGASGREGGGKDDPRAL